MASTISTILVGSVNPFSPGDTGSAWLLFFWVTDRAAAPPSPRSRLECSTTQGYYFGDTFQINQKLTMNYGVRWELPGPWTERHDRQVVFLPGRAGPLAASTGLPLTGNVALVNSAAYSSRYSQQFHWRLFAPRFSRVAYRLNEQTVVRAGYGMFFVPDDASFNDAPWGPHRSMRPLHRSATFTQWRRHTKRDPEQSLSQRDPEPGGPQRELQESTLYGTTMFLPVPKGSYGYTQQYNLNFEHDLGHGAMFGLASPEIEERICLEILKTSTNFAGIADFWHGHPVIERSQQPVLRVGPARNGTLLSTPTIVASQLLLPYPQFSGVFSAERLNRASSYNSFQAEFEKRSNAGGTILVAFMPGPS